MISLSKKTTLIILRTMGWVIFWLTIYFLINPQSKASAQTPATESNGCESYIWRAFKSTYLKGRNTANINDSDIFEQSTILNGNAENTWNKTSDYNQKPLPEELKSYLKRNRTAAFLVIKNGQLVQEHYFKQYNAHSLTNSFSMAKTVTTLLIGAAIDDGLIQGFDEPITHYLPEYQNNPRAQKATIAHLAGMISGHDWDEAYASPFSPTTCLYYGGHAERSVLARGFEREPNTAFEYSSGSTQLLGVVLKRALARRFPDKTISEYAREKLWQPLNMEGKTTWSLDRPFQKGGMEMTYCCVFSSARNFAKLGQLLLNDGRYNEQQIIRTDFIERMRTPNKFVNHYGYGLWTDLNAPVPFYSLIGHLGQFVIVIPSKQTIIVRLGEKIDISAKKHGYIFDAVYYLIDEGLKLAHD